MSYQDLPARLAEVRERIALHQSRAGWSHPVRIVAVTKQHGIDAIRAAREAGLSDVGENRVQEGLAKQAEAGEAGVNWHLIGTLQRNKAKLAVGKFQLIHSVDRPELVAELVRRCPPGTVQDVLVEVNCSAEPQKGGAEPESARELVESIVREPALGFAGLMTMAAETHDEAVQRAAFGRLRQLKEELERSGIPVRELSMGMSGDYPIAIEEGATMVRLGTVLFGERPR
jgi:pyridoxal phosphate enzyme (YggS family)